MVPKTAEGGYFIVKNSWGHQGYFYLPFEFANASLISDSWTALI
jgi:C1A family cysteine protease